MCKYCCVLFDYSGNTVDKTVQGQHLNQYIKIYLHRECRKTSFICCIILVIILVILLFLYLLVLFVYFDLEKFNLTVAFFIFLFMVTGRGIFCSAALVHKCQALIIFYEPLNCLFVISKH